ncbi:MAG: hypothetical protein ABI180_17920 [Microcoleus sp.]
MNANGLIMNASGLKRNVNVPIAHSNNERELAETLMEQERQRNQELLARLVALGVDPE